MASNPVAWFEIYVDDLARARAFYGAVFAVEFEALGDPNDETIQMMAFPSDMEKYGATGALVKMKDYPAGGQGALVYFGCEDCAVEESRVEGAGGTVVKAKESIGEYGFIALCTDTEGNMFGMHSMS